MVRFGSYAPEGFIALDNSALIYPSTEARFNANTFRLSMDFRFVVDRAILQKAVELLLERYPYYRVKMQYGFFWYYLTPNEKVPLLHWEGAFPVARFAFRKNNGYLFKVVYDTHRIAVECFHALTDGTGGLRILESIVSDYFHLAGLGDVAFAGSLDRMAKPAAWEISDPFQTVYDKQLPFPSAVVRSAYHRKARLAYDDTVKVVRAEIPSLAMRNLAKSMGATVTEYLCAVMIAAFQELQKREVPVQAKRRPIRLSVPMNLRTVFGLDTMRNFTLFALVGIEPALGEYSFAEIVGEMKAGLAEARKKKRIRSQIRRNVAGQRNPLMRFAPNIVKNPVFKVLSDSLGDELYSGIVSNLGYVKMPDAVAEGAMRMDFHLSPGRTNRVALAIVGWKDRIALDFTSFLRDDTELERLFCRFLVENGIPVSISSNRRF